MMRCVYGIVSSSEQQSSKQARDRAAGKCEVWMRMTELMILMILMMSVWNAGERSSSEQQHRGSGTEVYLSTDERPCGGAYKQVAIIEPSKSVCEVCAQRSSVCVVCVQRNRETYPYESTGEVTKT